MSDTCLNLKCGVCGAPAEVVWCSIARCRNHLTLEMSEVVASYEKSNNTPVSSHLTEVDIYKARVLNMERRINYMCDEIASILESVRKISEYAEKVRGYNGE